MPRNTTHQATRANTKKWSFPFVVILRRGWRPKLKAKLSDRLTRNCRGHIRGKLPASGKISSGILATVAISGESQMYRCGLGATLLSND